MTRKCVNKDCGHVSTSLFRRKHRCIICGSITNKIIARKLQPIYIRK